ncbi:MAG: hypothetical protein IJ025_01445 [Clostridia bacterium]|nr:hypothetical protein [Clostridia bacterium]
MADKKSFSGNDLSHIKEAICVDTNRVYDSCADKDCLTDLRVYLTDCNQHILESATTVRPRCAQILNCIIEVEKVPFNKGCYSVDLTFFVKVTLDAFTCPTSPPSTIEGLVTFGKKCILYGSDGNVKIFTSNYVCNGSDEQNPVSNTNPKAKVQCVDPIILDAQICRVCDCCNTLGDCCDSVPRNICCCFDGSFGNYGEKTIKVTLGVFTIIQLERDVQMLIPAYDFCVPTKECCCETEDPCETFRRINFPIDEFFPPNAKDCDSTYNYNPGGSCGCSK